MKPERGDPSAVGVGEELEVVEGPSSDAEALKDRGPAGLVLVAVGELDVRLGEGLVRLFELFEADDGGGDGAVGVPGVGLDEFAADATGRERKTKEARGKERKQRPEISVYKFRDVSAVRRRYRQRGYTHASNSESSKILWGSRSTVMSKPASSRAFAVVGVRAERCS
jgi:hypothetical protein